MLLGSAPSSPKTSTHRLIKLEKVRVNRHQLVIYYSTFGTIRFQFYKNVHTAYSLPSHLRTVSCESDGFSKHCIN